ncbi:MAG: hypothetical protein ACRD26_18960 [Vicinamibacterales bacterium]
MTSQNTLLVYVCNCAPETLTSLTVNGTNLAPPAGIAGLSGGQIAYATVPIGAGGFPLDQTISVAAAYAGQPAWQQWIQLPSTFADLYLLCFINGFVVSASGCIRDSYSS